MKVIDSGMPDEAYWNSLLDVPLIVGWLNIGQNAGPVVEIGCGYGTFTVPVARETNGQVCAFDIDRVMLAAAGKNAAQAGLRNVQFVLRDVVENGTGLESNSAGMVLLFNILHFNERRTLLEEAARILHPSGIAAIIHWRKDIETPRGPSVEVRPDEGTMLAAIKGLELEYNGNSRVLEPYHWGIQFTKSTAQYDRKRLR